MAARTGIRLSRAQIIVACVVVAGLLIGTWLITHVLTKSKFEIKEAARQAKFEADLRMSDTLRVVEQRWRAEYEARMNDSIRHSKAQAGQAINKARSNKVYYEKQAERIQKIDADVNALPRDELRRKISNY